MVEEEKILKESVLNDIVPFHGIIVNLYVSYKLDICLRNLRIDFTLGNCLFGAVKLTAMVILITMDIVVMALDLMYVHNFHRQTIAGVKIVIFFVMI